MIISLPNAPSPVVIRSQFHPYRSAATIMVALLVVSLTMAGAIGVQAADPNKLWEIVHDQCVPNQQQHGDATPCAMVDLFSGVERGYVVLKDLVGATQFLLIPTAAVRGIESPELLAPDAPNYFAAAWRVRTYVEDRAHRALPRESISLAVNSMFARSQDQLHIHIDCIRPEVRDALHEYAAQVGEHWAPFPVPLAGHHYQAMRVLGEELGQANPFKLLADGVPGARKEMPRHTLVVVGATFADGDPGFIVLDDRTDPGANPAASDWASGEDLQDHDRACAL
jgi:CDP-diacylglycerol pyrophosphatase